jgi:hypothetical protein
VAADLLSSLSRYACPVHVPNCCPPKIMEEAFDRCACFLTRCLPGFVKGLNGMATPGPYISTTL